MCIILTPPPGEQSVSWKKIADFECQNNGCGELMRPCRCNRCSGGGGSPPGLTFTASSASFCRASIFLLCCFAAASSLAFSISSLEREEQKVLSLVPLLQLYMRTGLRDCDVTHRIRFASRFKQSQFNSYFLRGHNGARCQ